MLRPALFVAVVAALMSGCLTDSVTFVLSQNQLHPANCDSLPPVTRNQFRSSGTLDLAGFDAVNVSFGYLLFPLIDNDLVNNQPNAQAERNRLKLERYDVELELDEAFGDVPDLVEEDVIFSKPLGNTFINPGGTAAIPVEVISADLARRLPRPAPLEQRLIMVRLQVFADQGSRTVASSVMEYPVNVCNGCLVGPIGPRVACADATDRQGNFCGQPQDEQITCCNDVNNNYICLDPTQTD